ncbi:MAG: DNA polymerase III subunit beta [Gammaproteobacteria bacterium]
MKLSIDRESLLKPLQQAVGVVEKRQTLPVLSNLLLEARGDRMEIIGTDLEVELSASMPLDTPLEGQVTLPARKLVDICRSLPEGATIGLDVDGRKAVLKSGRSRFSLATLAADEFPKVDDIGTVTEVVINQSDFKRMLERTHFAMAIQDVRYYLNGMLLEIDRDHLRAVATDGHRLAMCTVPGTHTVEERQQVIVPRKAVQELMRLLETTDDEIVLQLGTNHVRARLGNVQFTSKIIDGRFPDYDRVVPQGGGRVMSADREGLRQALSRTSILSNEKYRGVRLALAANLLTVQAHNPDQEEAEDEVEVVYSGEEFEIGFNVNYLLDALGVMEAETVEVSFSDANSSALISGEDDTGCRNVVMPMRL